MPVRRELHPVDQAGGEILHELRRAPGIARAHQEGRHQLRVRVDRRECPDVAHAEDAFQLGGDVLRLRVDEAPDLIHLQPLAGQTPERLVLVADAHLPDLPPELHDGVFRDVGHAGGSTDATALDQSGHDLDSLRGAEHVCHTRHYACLRLKSQCPQLFCPADHF